MTITACPRCDGSGHVRYEMRKVEPRNLNAQRERTCSLCHGSGNSPGVGDTGELAKASPTRTAQSGIEAANRLCWETAAIIAGDAPEQGQ